MMFCLRAQAALRQFCGIDLLLSSRTRRRYELAGQGDFVVLRRSRHA